MTVQAVWQQLWPAAPWHTNGAVVVVVVGVKIGLGANRSDRGGANARRKQEFDIKGSDAIARPVTNLRKMPFTLPFTLAPGVGHLFLKTTFWFLRGSK